MYMVVFLYSDVLMSFFLVVHDCFPAGCICMCAAATYMLYCLPLNYHAITLTSPPNLPPPPHTLTGDHNAASPLLHAATLLSHAHTQLQPSCNTLHTLYTTLPSFTTTPTPTLHTIQHTDAAATSTAATSTAAMPTAPSAAPSADESLPTPTSANPPTPAPTADEPLPTPRVVHALHQGSTTLTHLHAQLQEAPGALELPGWRAVVGTLGDACRAQQPWVSKLEAGGGRSTVGGSAPVGGRVPLPEQPNSAEAMMACIEQVQLAVQAMRRTLPTHTPSATHATAAATATGATATQQQPDDNHMQEGDMEESEDAVVPPGVDLVNAILQGAARMSVQHARAVADTAHRVLHAHMMGEPVPVEALTSMLTMLTAALRIACLEYVVLTKAVGKLGYVSACVLVGVLQEGFCMPEGQEEQDGMCGWSGYKGGCIFFPFVCVCVCEIHVLAVRVDHTQQLTHMMI